MIGRSTNWIERALAEGRFPPPSAARGKGSARLWRRAVVEDWLRLGEEKTYKRYGFAPRRLPDAACPPTAPQLHPAPLHALPSAMLFRPSARRPGCPAAARICPRTRPEPDGRVTAGRG